MMRPGRLSRLTAFARRIACDRSGLALMEFAFMLPVTLAVGGWGTELSFLALTNMRVSQAALGLADNASRVGSEAGAGVFQLREADVNDVFQGARLDGAGFELTKRGRIILSSLENVKQSYDTAYVQRIHWQRCMGRMNGTDYDSHYGATTTTAGSTATSADAGKTWPDGMGETNAKVKAPQDTGVMFVEVNYNYAPVFGTLFMSPRVIRYVASFMVRDNRDFTRIYNPQPEAAKATCDLYAA